MKGWLIFTAVFLLTALSVFGLGCASEAISCTARTHGLRMQHEWTVFGGCRVNSAKDGWIPLANYRSF